MYICVVDRPRQINLNCSAVILFFLEIILGYKYRNMPEHRAIVILFVVSLGQ